MRQAGERDILAQVMGEPCAGNGDGLAALLAGRRLPCATLVNVGAYDVAAVVARCAAFVDGLAAGGGGLIVTLLHAPVDAMADCTKGCTEGCIEDSIKGWAAQGAAASLWSFTRLAAKNWAPRGVRVNAIGLGWSPAGPFEPSEEAGRASGPVQAHSASVEDVVRTIEAMAGWPSMTGQIIRLGV